MTNSENLSEEENTVLWVEEAERRDLARDTDASGDRPAADVLRDARAKLR